MSTDAELLKKYPFAKSVVASEAAILNATRLMAEKIKHDYSDMLSAENPLVLICVLKGSYLFTADLARALTDLEVPNVVDFLCVSSYGSKTVSSGEVRMLLDLRNSIINRHCMIIEDIIDSARTLDFLFKILTTRSPASLKIAVLLDKPGGRQLPFSIHYRCFEIPNKFVVGYGLDYNERFRGMRDVVVLKPEVYETSKAAVMDSIPSKL